MELVWRTLWLNLAEYLLVTDPFPAREGLCFPLSVFFTLFAAKGYLGSQSRKIGGHKLTTLKL